MLLTRKSTGSAPAAGASSTLVSSLVRGLNRSIPTMDRRAFLRRSGIGVGAGIAASQLTLVRKARAADAPKAAEGGATKVEVKRTVCGHCSVGCAIDAVVENGVWVRQEPVFDSPINLGAHCAKGAAVREHGHGEYRLKYPMKLVNGKYQRISWDQALDEISKRLLEIREQSGPDALFVVGSSKHSNEQAYLLRKWMSFWGTNNCDHQARICHSTTVAGVANTWGYGAMTNSYNDMQNAKAALYIGSNAAEAHPVSMLHLLHAKETGCKVIVVDPRFTRTAAKADEYVRIRSGTDIPFLFGVLYHIFKNGWEDKKYIADRVYGMDEVREEVLAKWTPDKVQEVCGVDEATCYKVAEIMAKNRPSTIVWCMGQTQHSIGNAMVRASCILQLALGNIGVSGGGANIFRGHDNVQGATDVGPNPDSLPGYYGLAEGSFKHFAAAWGVDFDWLKSRYAPGMMTKSGMTVSRWVDGVLEKNELIDQESNLRALFFWGHAPNSQTRGLDMKRAMDKLDLLVVIDPFPSATAAMAAMPGKPEDQNPNRAVYLLPATTQFETSGSCTASNRSIQWREKVIEPLWESRTDHMIMYQLAEKLGFGKELVKNYKMVEGKGGMLEPEPESILREINRCVWTIGYTGQSPERLKAHMRNMHVFDVKTLRAKGGVDKETGYVLDGDYFGLPWPCYGTPELKHPGSPNLYDTSRHVMEGGGNFRANFGVERNGVSLLAADGSHSKGADDHDRLSRVRPRAAEEARLVGRADRGREAGRRGQELEDRPLRRHHPRRDEEPRLPSVRQREGACRGVELPRPDPAAPRADLFDPPGPGREVPDARRQDGLLASAHAVQDRAAAEQGHRPALPADHDLRPPGRVRGRRRGDPLQPVARGAAAGDVRRDQPGGGQRPRHPQRRCGVGDDAHRCPPAREGAGHRARGPQHGVPAVPLLRPLAGRRHAAVLPRGRCAGGAG